MSSARGKRSRDSCEKGQARLWSLSHGSHRGIRFKRLENTERDCRNLPNADAGFYRDDEGLEADVIIELADGRWAGIEVKVSEDKVGEGVDSLVPLRDKLQRNPRTRVRVGEYPLGALDPTEGGAPPGGRSVSIGSLTLFSYLRKCHQAVTQPCDYAAGERDSCRLGRRCCTLCQGAVLLTRELRQARTRSCELGRSGRLWRRRWDVSSIGGGDAAAWYLC